ncbi:MAG: hypothetical protein R3297_08675 [Desulfobulbales bacterium]|nr:hypothetical protein [Desulfobulbales bacterium]
MSALYIVQSWSGAIMLSDKSANSSVHDAKDLNFSVPKLFRVYPNIYAGCAGSVPIYKKALDDLAAGLYENYPIADASGLPTAAEVLRDLSVKLMQAASDYGKNRSMESDKNFSDDARVFLVMAGSYVAPEDIAAGQSTSCYVLETGNSYKPERIPGTMLHTFSELANAVWEHPSLSSIRRQGILQQFQVLLGIHKLCSTLGTYISEDYNAVVVGRKKYTVLHGTLVDLPSQHLVY